LNAPGAELTLTHRERPGDIASGILLRRINDLGCSIPELQVHSD
jgi:hypothetical protein